MTDDELIARVAEEQEALPVEFPIWLDASSAIALIGNLQLALRHPGNTGAAAAIARKIVDGLKEMFRECGYDAHVEVIERGDDPSHDYKWRKKRLQ